MREEESRPSSGSAGGPEPSSPPPSPPPPRSASRATVLLVAATFVAALLAGARWGDRLGAGLRDAWRSVAGEGRAAKEGTAPVRYYTCGMHPWVIMPRPGNCPICGMALVPLDPAKFTGEVTIDPVVTQDIGVRIEPVVRGPLARTIRTVGTIDTDETSVRAVNTKVSGWIEKLHVDYLGAKVNRGDPLFDLYSPALYTAQQEYLLALKSRTRNAPADGGGGDLVEGARTRLEYFDITAQEIKALEESGKPAKTMTIRSPYPGVVIEKHAFEGMKVDSGMQVYRIADLSKVWAMVTLYEYQLPFVEVGQSATMTLPYIPGEVFRGKVIYVYPYLDRKTRQVNVRLEFDNPNLLLKPGMFATVELRSTLAEKRTLAPRSAVIDTGERQVAFVSLGEGRFEPRDVRMGLETGDGRVEVLDGLKPGEMVVVSGQFLLDSEAKVREALAKMVRGDLASEQKAIVARASESAAVALPGEAAAALGSALDRYFAIGERLAADTVEGIAPAARSLAGEMDALIATEVPGDPHFWHKHEEAAVARGKALELVAAGTLDEDRLRFADLSVALSKLLRAAGVPAAYKKEVHELHCPMYREGQGGSVWMQPAGPVRNPYFGAAMLGCFDRREALPVAGRAAAHPAGSDEGGAPAVPAAAGGHGS